MLGTHRATTPYHRPATHLDETKQPQRSLHTQPLTTQHARTCRRETPARASRKLCGCPQTSNMHQNFRRILHPSHLACHRRMTLTLRQHARYCHNLPAHCPIVARQDGSRTAGSCSASEVQTYTCATGRHVQTAKKSAQSTRSARQQCNDSKCVRMKPHTVIQAKPAHWQGENRPCESNCSKQHAACNAFFKAGSTLPLHGTTRAQHSAHTAYAQRASNDNSAAGPASPPEAWITATVPQQRAD